MKLTRLVPAVADRTVAGAAEVNTAEIDTAEIDTAAPAARERLRDLYAPPRRRWLRLNLIAGVDGGARGPDGTSTSLSNGADRALLGAIRSLADVVLIGAETLRAEGYLVPRAARLAVVTASGRLVPAGAAEGAEPPGVLVLGPAAAEARARATLSDAVVEYAALPGTGRVDAADVVRELRRRGADSIVCEGGPELAAQLLDAGLVDELCLSTSPRSTGGELPVLGGARPRELRLAGLLADESGGFYARWLTEAR
ncbi:MAG: dihydrofolate reductase family protein [Micrococcales bacterium]|nr:dihydrofolate reductase family protein [Micrococcales bacterium]